MVSHKRYGSWDGAIGSLLQTLPGKLASHWLIQSMTYMDRTERTFKLCIDVVLTLTLAPLLRAFGWSQPVRTGLALLLAHTVNFLLNGHLRGALKWHGIGGVPRATLEIELVAIAQRLTSNPAIKEAFVYGSLSRGALHDGSDLDIRVVRRPGWRAGVRACVAAMLERSRSLASGVPLDLYVWDSEARLATMRSDESPVNLRKYVSDSRRPRSTPGPTPPASNPPSTASAG